MSAPELRIEALRVNASDGRLLLDVPALTIPAGQSLALSGPSGAGKSTFLHALSGLVRPASGQVIWGGQDIAALSEDARARFRRETLGMIFQDSHLFEELSALGNAALAAAFSPAPARAGIRQRAADWLARLGLDHAGSRAVDSFSGGERQRIAVARALSGDAPVILADEPTAALDRANADALTDQLVALTADHGRTLVVVTHDPALAGRLDRRITLVDGQIAGDDHA
ncbi:MAG: ATP-binding cassette domain-containing protein [Paracoccus sp. (in: a-proteobacteria)]|uniref:ABC transporter ATP-binding protein n=1 Tax=Paracoccus sp. TaxID=267 RepID=UPI0026E0021C|nr:ATP-binding cassette domain-containing protein [Paracoccus sp. (in: a-proteobacteria)]MDO5620844.1 ATP-binding cassette domain-containing protein [Paracoccus sp. (in: a-proteobacteria)]